MIVELQNEPKTISFVAIILLALTGWQFCVVEKYCKFLSNTGSFWTLSTSSVEKLLIFWVLEISPDVHHPMSPNSFKKHNGTPHPCNQCNKIFYSHLPAIISTSSYFLLVWSQIPRNTVSKPHLATSQFLDPSCYKFSISNLRIN